MNNLLKYSNGVGHLIMSLFVGGAGLALILVPGTDATAKGVGFSLLLTVSGAWFVPGAARQAVEAVKDSTPPPPPGGTS